MGLREEKKARQRQAIIDGAIELFRERGFEATRVQDIVNRESISEGTFFNYFSTKQAVLDAAVEGYLEHLFESLDRLDEEPSVLDRLGELMQESAAIFSGDAEFAALLALNFQMALARGSERQAFGLLTRLLEEGQRRGEVRADIAASRLSEAFTALLLVTMSNSVLSDEQRDGSTEPLDARLREAWSILNSGIKAPASPAGPQSAPASRSRATTDA